MEAYPSAIYNQYKCDPLTAWKTVPYITLALNRAGSTWNPMEKIMFYGDFSLVKKKIFKSFFKKKKVVFAHFAYNYNLYQ